MDDSGFATDEEEAAEEERVDTAAREELEGLAGSFCFVAMKQSGPSAAAGSAESSGAGSARGGGKWLRRLVQVDADRQTVEYFAVEEVARARVGGPKGDAVLLAGEVGAPARADEAAVRGWHALAQAACPAGPRDRRRPHGGEGGGAGLFAVGLAPTSSSDSSQGWWLALESPEQAASVSWLLRAGDEAPGPRWVAAAAID